MELSLSDEFISHGGYAGGEPVKVHAGNLTMYYQNGSLRYISSGRSEILRMIYPAVRDRNWITVTPEIIEERIESTEFSFRIDLKCRYRRGEIDFIAAYSYEGRQDDTLELIMEGEAVESFEKNRIGFCVLHPLEGCIGKTCVIEHPDGSSSQTVFPEEISPHQVFRNIRTMNWTASGGRFHLGFEGDIFETEDQRNWTDASYKTYSTPLELPYPAPVEKGTKIIQKISFRADYLLPGNENGDDSITIEIFHEESKKLPFLGIARSGRKEQLTEAEIRVLRPLRFDHYRINIYLFQSDWISEAENGLREAGLLSYKAELALFLDDNYKQQVRDFINWFQDKEQQVSCFLIYHKDKPATPDSLANYVIPLLMEELQAIRTGTGTNANFAQLNRNRPADDYANLICFSIHPQEHASDNLTLIENLRAQEYAVKSALQFSGERGIWVSPVNIRRRFNPNVSFYEHPHTGKEFPSNADPRLMTMFGACWTAISLKYLCGTEATGITWFETTGEKGIIQGEFNSRWPDEFPATRGMVFPVYFIFKYLLKHKMMKVVRSVSSHPLAADSLILSDGRQVRIIIVNFTGSSKEVLLKGCNGMLKVMTFSKENFSEAVMNYRWNCETSEKSWHSGKPMLLEPWSVTFAEGWRKQ